MSTRIYWLILFMLVFATSCKEKAAENKFQPVDLHAGHDHSLTGLEEFGRDSMEKRMDMSQFPNAVLDIRYANTNHPHQSLDIVYPDSGPAPFKFILVFHGGAWSTGDKQSEYIAPIFQAITHGYAVVSVNYRLSGDAKWPAQLHDAKAAVRFMRANALKYNLDASKIVAWGVSTGAHIAEMLAATNGDADFEDLKMGNSGQSSAIQGVIAWYGISDLSGLKQVGIQAANELMGFDVSIEKERAGLASPIELINENFPPILIAHGTNDKVAPFEQAVNMQEKVNEVTGMERAQLISFQGGTHGDAMIKTSASVARAIDFIESIIN